jgi:hypothetical protein
LKFEKSDIANHKCHRLFGPNIAAGFDNFDKNKW